MSVPYVAVALFAVYVVGLFHGYRAAQQAHQAYEKRQNSNPFQR